MFVTAFLRPTTAYRSVERYLAEFQTLAATGIPLLLFLDETLCDLSVPANVRVIPTSLDTSWVPPDVCLPADRNPDKDTVEYFCIQLSKLTYLTKAREYTDDPLLVWIDFSIFHIIRDPHMCGRVLRRIATSEAPHDKLLAPGCWPPGVYTWNSVAWRFCGGFLLGHRDLFPAALERQTQLVQSQLPSLTWEVNYWAQMEEHFIVYPADHDDTMITHILPFLPRRRGPPQDLTPPPYRLYCAWTGSAPMPPARLDCFQRLGPTTDCEIVCITPETLPDYILPEHPLHPAYPYLSETHKADYVRCYLLHFYGGGYTDIKLQSGSWRAAFDDLWASDAMVNGYPVAEGHTAPSCLRFWERLIGTNAIICKPNTPFTHAWYTSLVHVLDSHLDALKQHPATHPQAAKWDGLGYPLEWTATNSDIFHPISVAFLPHSLRTLPPPNLRLETYRY